MSALGTSSPCRGAQRSRTPAACPSPASPSRPRRAGTPPAVWAPSDIAFAGRGAGRPRIAPIRLRESAWAIQPVEKEFLYRLVPALALHHNLLMHFYTMLYNITS